MKAVTCKTRKGLLQEIKIQQLRSDDQIKNSRSTKRGVLELTCVAHPHHYKRQMLLLKDLHAVNKIVSSYNWLG